MAAIEVTKWQCPVCGGIFDSQSAASTCEGSHPGTMSFDSSHQVYKPYDIVPDNINITHGGKTYRYYLRK